MLKRKGDKLHPGRRAQLKVFREDEKQDYTCTPWIFLKEIITACIAQYMSTGIVLVAG